MSGSVTSLQRCPGHREPMIPLGEARFDDAGVEGDSHRSPGSIRHVLVQDQEVLDELGLAPGDVKENVTVRGVGANALPSGSRLAFGEVVLELTKECSPCSRMEEIRPGLQAVLVKRRGVYAKIVTPGSVRVGDPVSVQVAPGHVARGEEQQPEVSPS